MAKFISDISRFQSVITDGTRTQHRRGPRGYVERNWNEDGVCSSGYASPWQMPVFDRSTWRERIEERERKKERNIDRLDLAGWKPKYQAMTNYCWAACTVQNFEIQRVFETGEVVLLSTASLAAPASDFRNWNARRGPKGVGGWCSQAMKYAIGNGVATEETWPTNDPNPKHDNARSKATRSENVPLEYFDLTPRSFEQAVTALLSDFTIAGAFNWMRHAVTLLDPLYFGPSDFGILCANTGYLRDRNGFTVLRGSRAIPDEQVAVRSMS